MRPLRLVVPDRAHHVIQRGIRKGPIFLDDTDHLVYLRVLKEATIEHQVRICAYCLMTNHVHLIAIPETEKGLSNALRDAHTAYAMYFNAKHGFAGHTWQGRPKIFVMDDGYWRNAVRYVERNPVRAGMVRVAEDYLWSSAAVHCNLRDDSLLAMPIPWADEISDWSKWLETEETAEELKRIRTHVEMEKPVGPMEFLAELENSTGRKLLPQRRGRPKKDAAPQNQLALKIGELPV